MINLRHLAISCALTIALAACGIDPSASDSDRYVAVRTVATQGMDVLPQRRPRDMIDFGDAVVDVRVASERFEEFEGSAGAGLGNTVQRFVALEVDSVLWGDDLGQDSTVEIQTLGGYMTEAGYVSEVASGAPTLEVGHHYIISLFKLGDEWSQQTGQTVFSVVNGSVDMSDHALRISFPFDGLSIADLSNQLALIPADPLVEQYRNLDAVQRLERVQENRGN